jgi:hypothetical protein
MFLSRERPVTVREWLMTLDTYTNETYGRPASAAVVSGTCVACEATIRAFSTLAAAHIYSQRGLCERCQAAQRSISDTIVPFNQNYRAVYE